MFAFLAFYSLRLIIGNIEKDLVVYLQEGSLVHRPIIKHFCNAARLHTVQIVTFCVNYVSPSAFLFHRLICLNAVDFSKVFLVLSVFLNWYYFLIPPSYSLCHELGSQWIHTAGFPVREHHNFSLYSNLVLQQSVGLIRKALYISCCSFLAILSVGYHFHLAFCLFVCLF